MTWLRLHFQGTQLFLSAPWRLGKWRSCAIHSMSLVVFCSVWCATFVNFPLGGTWGIIPAYTSTYNNVVESYVPHDHGNQNDGLIICPIGSLCLFANQHHHCDSVVPRCNPPNHRNRRNIHNTDKNSWTVRRYPYQHHCWEEHKASIRWRRQLRDMSTQRHRGLRIEATYSWRSWERGCHPNATFAVSLSLVNWRSFQIHRCYRGMEPAIMRQ